MKYIGLLFIICFSCFSFSQSLTPDAKVSWGAELREPAGSTITKIIAKTGDGVYALRTKESNAIEGFKAYIELFDEKMNLDKSAELELKYNGKTRKFEDVIRLGGQLYLLTSFHNQVQKKNYLFKQVIHPTRLTTSEKDLEKVTEFETQNILKEGFFDVVQSKDSSKLLVYHQLPYKKGQPEQFKLRVFDEQFQPLWTNEIALPYNDEVFEVEEYQIDKAGNVYLLGTLYQNSNKIRFSNTPNYQYIILSYTQGGTIANEYRLELADKFITDLTFRIANDGNLICTGFYSEQGTRTAKGTYFFGIDATTKAIYNQNFRTFDFDILTQGYSNRQKEKAEIALEKGDEDRAPELFRFALNDLILRSDGGALLIAEQYYVEERVYRDFFMNTFRYEYIYYYNDIIVANIQPDGEIEWAARIPKRQVTRNDGGYYSSYAYAIVRDKIYLIFNDNYRNFNADNRNRLYNYNGRESVVALATINQDGKYTLSPLFPNREAEIVTRPKISRQTDRKEMVLLGELGRSFRLGKLTFE
jgi:hypothetical protein